MTQRCGSNETATHEMSHHSDLPSVPSATETILEEPDDGQTAVQLTTPHNTQV
jgi:hypothetical protein